MIGKTILHYQIIEQVGQGGMGVVYKAKDLKLDRFVALKFLPPHLSADETEKKRFIHEAKAASALDHPNICTVYEIDEIDSAPGEPGDRQMFIAMAYYEGETLKKKVERGPLELQEAINYAIQIAQGLAKAHQKEIVHRDIKPANMMIAEDDVVKIVDFGLVKLIEQTKLTKEGTTLGTIAYMSPEQARGEEVDQRTDIWSLGVVLYEMISGQTPFKGQYEHAVLYSIVNENPKPLTGLRSNVPMELERIVNKALAKNPGERYQHIGEMLVDLKSLKESFKSMHLKLKANSKPFLKKKPTLLYVSIVIVLTLFIAVRFFFRDQSADIVIDSIAVLPLENFSSDLKQEYFADGMTEALIADLAQISSLRVISRTSVMQYKGQRKPLTEIARELNVDAILEGSVYQDGQRVRITVQLIEAATDQHLWVESYERDLRDILALHGEVAQAVAREVKIVLTSDEETRLATTRPVDPAAHKAYLKGQYLSQQFIMGTGSVDQLRSGIEYFRQAIELDPDWALAYASLASAYHFLASSQDLPEFYPKSKAAALKALEIDETVSQAHGSLAFVLLRYDWDWGGAAREYRRANELNPNAHSWGIALFLKSAGRYEDAIRWLKRAEERNPLLLGVKAQLGGAYTCAGQYDKAIAHLRNTLELNPNHAWARYFLAGTYLRLSMYEEAIAESQEAVATGTGEPEFLAQLGYAYSVAGKREEALKVLEQYHTKNGDFFVNELAALYLALGRKDEALALLQKAFAERSAGLLTIKCSIVADSLQDNPSFQAILRGINFPQGDIQIGTGK